jgi:hypothetical protein
MSTTCKACGGPVCPYCGGCITCGECSCMYDEIDKATADTKAQLDAANARIADLEAKLAEAVAACELGWGHESGPAFLRRVAHCVGLRGNVRMAAQLQIKADAQEAVIAKAKGTAA